MTRLILRRVLAAPLVLLAVLTLVFALVEAAPGSPADAVLGERPAPPLGADTLAVLRSVRDDEEWIANLSRNHVI